MASIKPQVKRPCEKLAILDGLWLQRMSDDSYMISPLVKRLGSSDLPLKRRKAISCVLALRILARRHINQWEAFSAIGYFIGYFIRAGAHQNAMLVLIEALRAISEQEEISDDAFLGALWKDEPLPPDTDLGLRIFLRSFQLNVNRRLGRNVTILFADIVNLIEAAGLEDCWPLYHMTYEIIHYKEAYQDNWNFVHRAISKAIVTFPEATMSDGTKLASICPIGPEKFIWLVVPNITKAEQLRDWIEMVAGLPEPAVQRAFEGQDADEACVEISNLLWPSETEKPKESRQWEEIISCFDELIQKAQEIKLDLLWACGRRAKMIILAESLDDLDSAMAIGMDTLKKSGDPRIQYLIQQFIGHQYYYLKKYEDAYPWLERAANQDVRINPRGRIRTLMFLSETVVEDPSRAVEIAQDGVNFARENESVTEAELVRALAELSIAKWLASDNMSLIFEILEETCNRLLACKEDNIFWKALFIRLQK